MFALIKLLAALNYTDKISIFLLNYNMVFVNSEF